MNSTICPGFLAGLMRVRFQHLLWGALLVAAAGSTPAQTPAFPGALGFGAIATGGRNGTVYHVTTLADSGPGSFRDAVSSGNRTIVFDVGGYISLQSAVSAKSNLTIAGQTAPGGGIGFSGGEISFAGQANIIMRHVRIRPGSDTASTSDDALSLYQAKNAIFDHCSIEFAPWNNIDGVGDSTHVITNITFQSCIIANPTYQQFGCHSESVGGTWSWFYNVFANSHNRNPLAKVNTVFINNAEYNCSAGYTTHTSTHFNHDLVNNYFVAGPASGGNFPWYQIDNNQSMYFTGNLYDGNKNATLDGGATVPLPGYQGGGTILAAPWSAWTTSAPIMSADLAWRYDVSLAGTLPRDEMDALVISQMKTLGNGTAGTGAGTAGPSGGLYTSQTQTGLGNNGYGTIPGGATPLDSDGDGMPDYWELATSSDPYSANSLTNTADGYTLLEHYLNFLAAPHTVTPTNSATDVDLTQYAAGFAANTIYTVGSASNGVVSLVNGSTAHFVPTANFAGLGSFTFTVNDGVALTNTVAVLVTPVSAPQDLIWQGDGNGNVWNTTNTLWSNGTNAATFHGGDTVTFDDSGSNTPFINILGTVAPASLTVAAAKDYTFGGSGVIAGAGSLAKSGAGSLTLSNANTFSGGITINSGTVLLAGTSAQGTGGITLNGGTLALAEPGGPATYSNPITVVAPSVVQIFGSGNWNQALNGALSGQQKLTIQFDGGGMFSARSGFSLSGYSGAIQLTGAGTFRWYGGTGGNGVAFDLGESAMITRDGGTIALGSLTGDASATLGGASSSATASTYVIGGLNADTTFAGTILDGSVSGAPVSTAITKTGAGTLTLTGNNNYSGATSLGGGTLIVNGSNSSSAMTVSNGATLGGTGTIAGGVTANSGGALSPGAGIGSAGTLTVGSNLTLAAPTLYFDLSDSPNGANDQIVMQGGTLAMSGVNNYVFNLTDGALGAGTYYLITGATNSTAWSGVTHNLSAGSRQTYSLNRTPAGSNPSYTYLTVSGSPAAALVWQGTNGSAWDNATTNWLNDAAADRFYNMDAVVFNDTATNGTVSLASALQPASILVSNNSLAYSFTGGGTLTGSGTLTKTGAGLLTINTTNGSFTSAIQLAGGTTSLAFANGLGSGPVNLSNGAILDLAGSLIYPGNLLNVPASQTGALNSSGGVGNGWGGNLAGAASSTLNISSGVSFSGTTSAQFDGFTGVINIQPGATLRFAANGSGNTYGSLNPTFIINGTLRPRNAGNTIQLGALSGSGSLAGPQSNAGSGDTLYVIGGNDVDAAFNGSISSNNAVAGSQVIVSKIGSGTLTLGGASTYTGGTTVSSGTLLAGNTTGSATGTGDLEIQPGATLTGTGIVGSATTVDDFATFAPGNPAGVLTFTSDLTLSDNTSVPFTLGASSSSVAVGGNLFLAGKLIITNSAGFGPGIYPLFTCAGSLIFDNFVIASAPVGYNYSFDTNTAGVVNLVVATPTPPVIANPSIRNGSFVFSGSGGAPGATYYVATTTNLATPLTNWTRIDTNQFDENGNFSVTNPPATNTQNFYRLELP